MGLDIICDRQGLFFFCNYQCIYKEKVENMKHFIHCFSIMNALNMKDSLHSNMIDELHIINNVRVILIIENI